MQDVRSSKSLILRLLASILMLTISSCRASAAPQTTNQAATPPWRESLAAGSKGTHTKLPKTLADTIRANPDDCNSPLPTEAVKVDAYLIHRHGLKLIAVGGRGFCFCSATGNCAFWVFRNKNGKYEKILDTDMVQQFGFVHSTTNGLPDLVLWSHWSAFESGGAWWKFNGESYERVCTWVLTSQREDEKGNWVDAKPYIAENTCKSGLE